jgi:Phage tail tube protein
MEITEIGLLAIRQESTYGVDASPGATNVIPTVGDSLTYEVQSTATDRKAMDGTHDRIAGFNTMAHVVLKFRYELRGNGLIQNGSPANPVEIDPLLQAAHLIPSYNAEPVPGSGYGSVDYFPAIFTDSGPSLTCYWWSGLKLHKLLGGKVDFKLTVEVGKVYIMEFTVTGKYLAVADASLPTGVTFNSQKPPLADGSTALIGDFTGIFSKFELELGNRISLRKSMTSPDGIAGFVITGSTPKGRIDPETVASTTHPFWTDWKKSTLFNILLIGGSHNGNQFVIECDWLEWKSVNYATRDEVRIHQGEFNIVQGGDVSPFHLSFN